MIVLDEGEDVRDVDGLAAALHRDVFVREGGTELGGEAVACRVRVSFCSTLRGTGSGVPQ